LALTDIETNSNFLKRAANLLADAADEAIFEHTLRTEINSLKVRHFAVQEVFKRMAMYAPAFGMLGTLIGLIQMLAQLDDPTSVGPAMAIALLTTFYGSFLATMFFLPIAGKLKTRTMDEIMNLEIIYHGTHSILLGNNPMMLYEKLTSYLPERERQPMGGPQREAEEAK
jgi:chemotaxis protein MotA